VRPNEHTATLDVQPLWQTMSPPAALLFASIIIAAPHLQDRVLANHKLNANYKKEEATQTQRGQKQHRTIVFAHLVPNAPGDIPESEACRQENQTKHFMHDRVESLAVRSHGMALRLDLQSGGFAPALFLPRDALFCLSASRWVLCCLTFELRHGAKGAKRPLGRRLERRVRPRACGRA